MPQLTNLTHLMRVSLTEIANLPPSHAVEVSERDTTLKLFRITFDAEGAPGYRYDADVQADYIGDTKADTQPFHDLVNRIMENQLAAGLLPQAQRGKVGQTLYVTTGTFEITGPQAKQLVEAYRAIVRTGKESDFGDR